MGDGLALFKTLGTIFFFSRLEDYTLTVEFVNDKKLRLFITIMTLVRYGFAQLELLLLLSMLE
jgi:hypothetical protein